MKILNLNLIVAWVWILFGFLSGLVLGLNFHRENWLGGYGSHQRRLYRLGHISFFGLAIINLLFAFTILQFIHDGVSARVRMASVAFALGAFAMPLCCAVTAHWKEARWLFSLPVTSLLVGAVCTLWEVLKP